ncbi:MAG: hypothetical protein L0Y58_19185 [Verrucomicrobia subdivision 3 bacterium]|nr:hypothetical protein [Limisphaerales bacterium]
MRIEQNPERGCSHRFKDGNRGCGSVLRSNLGWDELWMSVEGRNRAKVFSPKPLHDVIGVAKILSRMVSLPDWCAEQI